MPSNVFNRILQDQRRKSAKALEQKKKQAKKDKFKELSVKEQEKQKEELEKFRREQVMDVVAKKSPDEEKQLRIDKALVITGVIKKFVMGDLLLDIRDKMPRSEFAGIRNSKRNPKRTQNLRNALTSKAVFLDRYRLELPEAKIPYARPLNISPVYITKGYWKKTGNYVYDSLYDELKKLEPKLSIKVTKGR